MQEPFLFSFFIFEFTDNFIYSDILLYIMVADKPLKISGETKKKLDELKIHPRETYDDVIARLIKDKLKEQ